MQDLLPFIVIGLTSGAIYGLAGVGLVLTFKTSGIFNFGHGSVAALAAFVFYFLRDQHGVPWPVALALSGLAFAVILGLLFEAIARSVSLAPVTTKVLATIGIVLAVLSIGTIWFPGTPRYVAPYLPTKTIEIGGVFVGYNQIIVVVFSVAATALLYFFFKMSRLGIAMRAVVVDPDLLARTGQDPVRVRRWAWVIGCVFAAMSGVALVPDLGLNALVLTMLVIQAFGAAAIGRFSSLPLTYCGGLIIGVASALATKYTAAHPSLGGLPPSIPFIVLILVLVATPKARLLEQQHRTLARAAQHINLPGRVRLVGVAAVLAVLLVAPTFAGIRLHAFSSVIAMSILILSLSLLVKVSGQVSLGHMGFAAVGASSMAHFSTDFGLPWLLALFLAAVVVVPVGALVAIPAMRLSGTFLAIATLGFGILLEQFVYPFGFMFTTDQSGLPTPRPGGSLGPWEFGSDRGFYYVLLAFAVSIAVLLRVLRVQPFGRILRAMGDATTPIRTQGGSTNTTLLLAFCTSAFIAGLAGALMASLSEFAVGTQFSSFSSLLLFAVVAVVALGDPWNALVGAAALILIPAYADSSTASTYLQLAFGVAAVTFVFSGQRSLKLPDWVSRALDARGVARDSVGFASGTESRELDRESRVQAASPNRLLLEDLVVRFGGINAVSRVSLEAPTGKITGLIGPNGAGKTTIFNACSGLVRPASGRVLLGERDITRATPQRRAHQGLGRTFQQTQLFDSLTVFENISMGLEAYTIRANVLRQLAPGQAHRANLAQSAADAMELVGISHLRDAIAGSLSVGQRRLVELARCIVAPFDIVLLDEPSSGLDEDETRRFGAILRTLVAERDLGILLVEHDMELVRNVCDHVYVIDFGVMIFEGGPHELATSDVVRSAYLGDEIPDQDLAEPESA